MGFLEYREIFSVERVEMRSLGLPGLTGDPREWVAHYFPFYYLSLSYFEGPLI